MAVWYLREFPEGKSVNNDALKEFQQWYADKIAEEVGFDSKFNEALSYVKAHPELINPVKETSKKDEAEEPADASDQNTTPAAPADTVPNTSATTPGTQPSGNAATGSGEQTSSGKYPHLDEAAMNKYTAAQVANWVYQTFPPDGANWDYQKLSDYYNWLEAKGKTDSAFVSSVNGYLKAMNWSENA